MSARESFWDYSCRVYALPGVSTLCLRLQNEHGQDVNMLLFAVWFAQTRGEMNDALLQQALAFSQSWSGKVVRPLRGARGWLKETLATLEPVSALERNGMQELRTQIKALELRTEQYQQTRLEALARGAAQTLTDEQRQHAITANLQRVASCYAPPSPALQDALNALCSALASA